MSDKNDNIDSEKIISFLNGEMDEAQQLEFQSWLEQKENNRKEFESIATSFIQTKWVYEENSIDLDSRKKKALSKIKKTKKLVPYISIAASIIVLFVVSIIFFSEPKQEEVLISQTVITPVSSKAILTTSTGKQIYLNDSTILNDDFIFIDSTGKLNYNVIDTDWNEIHYNKIIIPRGAEYEMRLSDGTIIFLNSETEMEYPINFIGDTREVNIKGEAYFVVVKDEQKPFIVRSGEFTTKVYGTEFNVNTYDENNIEVVLVTGNVGIRANEQSKEYKLTPNQLGSVNIISGETSVKNVDVHPYIAWKNKDMVFEDEKLECIMEKVSRWYDIDVEFENENVKQVTFEANIPRYSEIEELIYLFERTSNVRFTMKDRTIYVR